MAPVEARTTDEEMAKRGLLRRQRVSELWARFKHLGLVARVWYWKMENYGNRMNLSCGHGARIGCLLIAGQSICALFLLVEVVWDKSRTSFCKFVHNAIHIRLRLQMAI